MTLDIVRVPDPNDPSYEPNPDARLSMCPKCGNTEADAGLPPGVRRRSCPQCGFRRLWSPDDKHIGQDIP